MRENYFVNWQAPLWKGMDKRQKYFDIPLNSRVDVFTEDRAGDVYRVEYTNAKGMTFAGWVESRFLEPMEHPLEINCVDMTDIQTPDGTDAAQYVLWDGVKQTNECGPISVAYILGLPLSAILSNWKTKNPPFYKRIFGQGKATGTGVQDLIDLFALANRPAYSLSLAFKKYSPHFLRELLYGMGDSPWEKRLGGRQIIFSCYLDTVTGRLRGSGVLHWCVLVDVVPDRQGFGWVDVMNPFDNCVERYSWQEFLATTRNSPYGIYT